MSFPFGHHGPGDGHHHHHHDERQREEEHRRPHSPPHVQHVSHQGGPGHFEPPPPPHHHHSGGEPEAAWSRQPTVRIYCKADPSYSLSIRDGAVVLAKGNPSDPYQHWIRDLKYSTKVKDEEGLPSFSLVNKVTGEAIKHSVGATHPVRLVPYNSNYMDESLLWAESKDTGENFRCLRMVNNIRLNFDAFHWDRDHGGVRDGTKIVLWEWTKGDNQRWKIVPY